MTPSARLLMVLCKYSEENVALRNYFRDKPVSIDPRIWEKFVVFCKKNYPNLENKYKRLLTNGEEFEENYYQFPKHIIEAFEKLVKNNPEKYYNFQYDDAPSWATMDLQKPKLLHRQTWLIHFTDNPWDLQSNGFTIGVDDMDRLALTTNYKNEGFTKKYGGYNFAFDTNSKYVGRSFERGRNKYGKHAVLFQNSGVVCYHCGDDEEQIMFWGKQVDPRSIIVLYYDGDNWLVCPHIKKTPKFSRNQVVKFEDIEKAINWVQLHHRQYARFLYGY